MLFLFVLGAIVGWLSAMVLNAENLAGLRRNILAGMAGALTAGLLLSPLVGGGNLLSGTYPITALALSLLGALVAISGTNLFRRLHLR